MRPQLRHILCWRPSRSLRRNAWQSFVLDHALKYIAQGRAKETVLLLQLSDHADGCSSMGADGCRYVPIGCSSMVV